MDRPTERVLQEAGRGVIPQYRQTPTIWEAARSVILRFVPALLSTLSALALLYQAKAYHDFPTAHHEIADAYSYLYPAILLSAWSSAALIVIAGLQNWLGKTHLRIRLFWSTIAGAFYPLLGWALANYGAAWFYAFVGGLTLFIIYPIGWGYIAFKSPPITLD